MNNYLYFSPTQVVKDLTAVSWNGAMTAIFRWNPALTTATKCNSTALPSIYGINVITLCIALAMIQNESYEHRNIQPKVTKMAAYCTSHYHLEQLTHLPRNDPPVEGSVLAFGSQSESLAAIREPEIVTSTKMSIVFNYFCDIPHYLPLQLQLTLRNSRK